MLKLASRFFLCLLVTSCFAVAEPPLANRLPYENFSNFGFAKIEKVDGKEVVSVRLPGWRQKLVDMEYTVEVPVTRVVEEEVTKNGKVVKEIREVTDMVTENRVRQIPEYTGKGPVKGDLPLSGMKAWSTKGKLLTEMELKNAFEKVSYILCLMQEPAKGEAPLDPFMASALRSDLIILFSPELRDLYYTNVEETPSDATGKPN